MIRKAVFSELSFRKSKCRYPRQSHILVEETETIHAWAHKTRE
jgi:hypothetical protein